MSAAAVDILSQRCTFCSSGIGLDTERGHFNEQCEQADTGRNDRGSGCGLVDLCAGVHGDVDGIGSSMAWHKPHQPGHLARGGYLDIVRKGSESKSSKLTEDLVRQIRASDRTNADWARQLGVKDTTIRAARLGITWKHVQNNISST